MHTFVEFGFWGYMINIKRTGWKLFSLYQFIDLLLLIIHALLWYDIFIVTLQVCPQGFISWKHNELVSAAWVLLVHFLDICRVEEKMGFKKEEMLGFSPSVSARTAVRSFFWFSQGLDLDLAEAMSYGKEQAFPFLRMKHWGTNGTVSSHLTWFKLFK